MNTNISATITALGLGIEPVTEPSARLLGTHRVTGWDDPKANHGLGLMGKQLERRQETTIKRIALALGLTAPDFVTEGEYHGDGIRVGGFCDSIYITTGPSTHARKIVADQLGINVHKCSDEDWNLITELAAEQ
jgi:hypothetical protein